KRQIVDFMQVRYRGPHDDNLNEKMAVGLGLQFPNSGNQKLKMAELQLEQQELQREQERKETELQKETTEVHNRLLLQLEAYSFYQKTSVQERQELQNIGSLIAQREGFNPLLLLDIEERHLETQLKSLKKREVILYGFLEYLEESGKMCMNENEEFVNYLLK
ncbi:MAG: TolC family protein, partial [Chitinophagales bacterium]